MLPRSIMCEPSLRAAQTARIHALLALCTWNHSTWGGAGSAVIASQPGNSAVVSARQGEHPTRGKPSRLRSHGTLSTCQQAAKMMGSKAGRVRSREVAKKLLHGQGLRRQSTAGMQVSREGRRQGVSSACFRSPETGSRWQKSEKGCRTGGGALLPQPTPLGMRQT